MRYFETHTLSVFVFQKQRLWSYRTNFERVSDHCSNVAVGIIDISEHTMNAHEVIKNLKSSNAHYSERVEEYSKKYSVAKLA